MKKIYSFYLMLSCGFLSLNAQDNSTSNSQFQNEYDANAEVIDELVVYPEEIRDAIFEVSTAPQVVVKTTRLQKQSSGEFQNLVDKYPQSVQQKFYDLNRYPGLIEELIIDGDLSIEQRDNILAKYPEEIRKTGRLLESNEFETLYQISILNAKNLNRFEAMLSEFPEDVKYAMQTLFTVPEVIDILEANLSQLMLLGEAYSKDPIAVTAKADQLHDEVTQRNSEELAAWEEELKNNPDALKEFDAASDAYEKEFGTEEDEYWNEKERKSMKVVYVDYSYNYWCGYPTWYPYGYWYSYPVSYHRGYYYDHFGHLHVFSRPSFHFSFWYFNNPWVYCHYPYFTGFIFDYHTHHPYHHSSMHYAYRDWRAENEHRLDDNWFKNDEGRVTRIKELGKFEEDYSRARKENPTKELTRDEYLRQSPKTYEGISRKDPVNRPNTVQDSRIDGRNVPRPGGVDRTTPKPEQRPDTREQEKRANTRVKIFPEKRYEPTKEVRPPTPTKPKVESKPRSSEPRKPAQRPAKKDTGGKRK